MKMIFWHGLIPVKLNAVYSKCSDSPHWALFIEFVQKSFVSEIEEFILFDQFSYSF